MLRKHPGFILVAVLTGAGDPVRLSVTLNAAIANGNNL